MVLHFWVSLPVQPALLPKGGYSIYVCGHILLLASFHFEMNKKNII
jgi:hypothetical protein